ncbi:hypothetical protein BGZ73_001447, partial [Actinomortierella ambigua]
MRRSSRLASKPTDRSPRLTAPASKRSIGTNDDDDNSDDAAKVESSPKRAKQPKKEDHAIVGKKVAKKEAGAAAGATPVEEPTKAKSKAKKDPPASQLDDRKEGEIKIWLMKAEPDSRVVKGKDVKFSIDDLAAMPNGTSPWDG